MKNTNSFINSWYKRKDEYCFEVKITKTQAKYLLSINDEANRLIESDRIENCLNLMNSDKWEVRKGSFLGLAYYDKMLIDGQHRLNAFIQSKLEILETFICFG